MPDLITLQCPNCGGSLQVSENVTSLRCDHCGVEHLVRYEQEDIILESYARCPICNRNDRSEKVSAILRTQKHNIEGISYQTQTTFVKVGDNYRPRTEKVAVPTSSTQVSELARHLVPPQKPAPPTLTQPSSTNLTLVTIAVIIFLGIAACLLMAAAVPFLGLIEGEMESLTPVIFTSACFALPAFVMVAIGIWLWRVQIPRLRQESEYLNTQYVENARDAQEKFAEETRKWESATQRWGELYYCGRDDCVFIPGEKTSAPLAELRSYLYS